MPRAIWSPNQDAELIRIWNEGTGLSPAAVISAKLGFSPDQVRTRVSVLRDKGFRLKSYRVHVASGSRHYEPKPAAIKVLARLHKVVPPVARPTYFDEGDFKKRLMAGR